MIYFMLQYIFGLFVTKLIIRMCDLEENDSRFIFMGFLWILSPIVVPLSILSLLLYGIGCIIDQINI